MPLCRTAALSLGLALGATALAATPIPIPPAPKAPVRPVVNDYFGTRVVDPYRWMETPDSPELAAWMKAQNARTRAVLADIPGRAALQKEVAKDDSARTRVGGVVRAGDGWFYLKRAPGQSLYALDERAGGVERVLVDPNRMSQDGTHYAIGYFAPSFDGRFVAYSLASGGSEEDTLHVLDVRTAKPLPEAITRVDGDSGFDPVAWRPDGRSFFYYRQRKLGPQDPPSAKFLKSRAYLHFLGRRPTGDGDQAVFGFGLDPRVPFSKDQDALVVTRPGSAYAFGLQTKNEDQTVITGLYVARLKEVGRLPHPWKRVTGPHDGIQGFDVCGSTLFLLSHENAPRLKIVSTSLRHPDFARAKVVVPDSAMVIKDLVAAKDGLYVRLLDGGMGRVERMLYAGAAPSIVKLPFEGTAMGLTGDATRPGVVFGLESWTRSPRWLAYSPAAQKLTRLGLVPPSPLDFSNIESIEVNATSYDGTLVPLSIVLKKGTKLDGENPTLLIGYGAYGIDFDPYFLAAYLPWLQRGGILAFAHIRGGGEYGEGWHEAGMKLKKLNTVFDFIYCGQYLVQHRYTSPKRLSGWGTSAGGITIGGAITWRPRLFAAAIDDVGMTDTLRFETTPNGPPNVVEIGSVSTPAGFHGLYAMSAYAHVRDGVPYPAVLLITGANDPRVAPWIVAKMAARLQAATSSGKPVLLRVSYDAGHGIGSTRKQMDSQLADIFSFLLWRLGVPPFAGGPPLAR